jgi:hypothetical protein
VVKNERAPAPAITAGNTTPARPDREHARSAPVMTLPMLLSAALLGPSAAADDVEATPLGRRVPLVEGATLFVPEGYRPAAGGVVDVVFHLHGAPSVVEPALTAAGWTAVLVEFNRQGLSNVYTRPFSDRALFPRLLDAALAGVKRLGLADEPRAGRVVVSSFSAGFGGVRELLKVPGHFARIDGLILADSLYCGYQGDAAGAGGEKRPDPALMDGFRRYAREAAAGRKAMLVTHSAQVPGGYASTTETADDLIREVGGTSEPASVAWADGWTQTRRVRKGRLLVLGFSGAEGADHMQHLRQIGKVWRRFRELEAEPERPGK